MSSELLPCPFCGGKNLTVVNGCWVKCLNLHCGARGPMDTRDEAEAITAWNTRQPSPALSVAVEALEDISQGAGPPDVIAERALDKIKGC